MTIRSHNPKITHLNNIPGNQCAAVYNLSFDYRGYALSFYLGTPAELLVFAPGVVDREDMTESVVKDRHLAYLPTTAEGLRDAMEWIDTQEEQET